ncbi:hypothetical protein LN650_13660 [Klebsiella pneumoniae subsp. pneumoniae]|nr:hypothetical protein [Klebsiella pneumoniae subsp. pneumoniae]
MAKALSSEGDNSQHSAFALAWRGRIGMSPQPTKTLQQHIGWRKTADEEISIYIEGLFQNLGPD